MKASLFGFTGLGNAVLRGLLKADVHVNSVFTKKYFSAYPYYDEIQMEDLCARENISCYSGKKINSKETFELLNFENPDLIIVASFNQIISKDIIDIPKLGIINLHPSLLPKYRGPYPDQAVLLNDEKETGISIHYLTEELDSGNIILQKKLKIDADDNYSSLKKKISVLSEEMIPEAVNLFRENVKPKGTEQKESEATFFPKPKAEEGYLENAIDVYQIRNRVRALNPFPGTSFLSNGTRVDVDRCLLQESGDCEDKVIFEDDYIDVYLNSCSIRLFKKK